MEPWWFFRLDGEETTRYAPFAASPQDSKESVQKRIIAYYAELLVIKARPVHQRPTWHRPARAATPEVAAAPAPVAAASPES
ncbi:MAG TPA: hypothetical protein VM939_01085 [Gemmatimonadaceae bacterium]|nr:hypothetical protein [Gemmatimonadaceae bacterium]